MCYREDAGESKTRSWTTRSIGCCMMSQIRRDLLCVPQYTYDVPVAVRERVSTSEVIRNGQDCKAIYASICTYRNQAFTAYGSKRCKC